MKLRKLIETRIESLEGSISSRIDAVNQKDRYLDVDYLISVGSALKNHSHELSSLKLILKMDDINNQNTKEVE